MLISAPYDRLKAVDYANTWAYRRNPAFYDFSNLGGDCTNFASQCLLAGSGFMNYPAWYYYSLNDRSPSFSSVEFLYDFLIKNTGLGPRGMLSSIEDVKAGDLIQLSFTGERFEHSLIIVSVNYPASPSGTLIATHSNDACCRPLDTYKFRSLRFIHIRDVGIDV